MLTARLYVSNNRIMIIILPVRVVVIKLILNGLLKQLMDKTQILFYCTFYQESFHFLRSMIIKLNTEPQIAQITLTMAAWSDDRPI